MHRRVSNASTPSVTSPRWLSESFANRFLLDLQVQEGRIDVCFEFHNADYYYTPLYSWMQEMFATADLGERSVFNVLMGETTLRSWVCDITLCISRCTCEIRGKGTVAGSAGTWA